MADPVTGLTVNTATGGERVLLTWTNPGALDGDKVSMKPSASGTWIEQYLNVPITSIYLYPTPDVSYDYKVETVLADVVSAPDTVTGMTLDWLCDEWGVELVDVSTPSLFTHLGLVEDWSSLQRDYLTKISSFLPMGAEFPKDFPARARYKSWSQFKWTVFATSMLDDGSVIDNKTAVIDVLEALAPPRLGLTLWRDRTGFETYGKILPPFNITPLPAGHFQVQFVFEERLPPTIPLTAFT